MCFTTRNSFRYFHYGCFFNRMLRAGNATRGPGSTTGVVHASGFRLASLEGKRCSRRAVKYSSSANLLSPDDPPFLCVLAPFLQSNLSEKDNNGSVVSMSPPKPTPIKRSSLQVRSATIASCEACSIFTCFLELDARPTKTFGCTPYVPDMRFALAKFLFSAFDNQPADDQVRILFRRAISLSPSTLPSVFLGGRGLSRRQPAQQGPPR